MLIKTNINPELIYKNNGVIIKYNKLLPEAFNIEFLNGNKEYLKYNDYVLPYSTDFINYINTKYSKYILNKDTALSKKTPEVGNIPFSYQLLIQDYLSYGTPYRGLLIAHGLGSGKTRTCILVSESFRRNKIPILFLGPATLKNSFINELYKWGDDDIKIGDNVKENSLEKLKKRALIDEYYTFISSNSSNLLVQLARRGIGFPDKYENLKNKSVADFINKNPNIKLDYPKNMLIILEEAHNINQKFSSKSSKTIKTVYSLLKHAQDCKIIALSATPIINNPFEICSLLNVIKGPLIDKSTLLPESEDEFKLLYIDNENKIKNKAHLQQRILGLISYYKGIDSDTSLYPDLIFKPNYEIPMSMEQNTIHDYYLELDLKKFLNKENVKISLESLIKEIEEKEQTYGLPQNSYRIRSRTACNFVWKVKPTDVDKPEMNVLPHILEFKNINFKDPYDIAKLFFKEPPTQISQIRDQINSFIFDNENDKRVFYYYDFIMDAASSIKLIKDILTCAVLLVYCNISRLPKILNVADVSLIKNKTKYDISPILKYLTEKDIIYIEDIVKSRRQKIEDAINLMVADSNNYFSDSALLLHSPKMLQLFNNIISGDGCLKITTKSVIVTEDIEDLAFDLETDIDELQNEDEEADIDMTPVIGKLDNDKILLDKQFLLLQNTNPLYPSDDLSYEDINQGPDTLLQMFIKKNNINVEYLLKTENRYIIYTTNFHIYKNKLYIKNNNYGIGLMYYRNYLKSIEPYNVLPVISNYELVEYNPIYSTLNVEGGPAFVYSEFNNAEGIAIFSKILDYNGFSHFNSNDYDENELDELSIEDFAPRYVIISGNTDMFERNKILKFFNHPINKHGQLIQIILGTSAASEGINLRFIRQVHILEPFWHNVKIQQVIGRARRVHSHSLLPIDERNVYIYKYISKSITNILSTDEWLYKLAEKKSVMIEDLYTVIRGSAIDCSINADSISNTCFQFPKNRINEPAFKLPTEISEEEKVVKENIVKIEKAVKRHYLKNAQGVEIGYYLITDKVEPAEIGLYTLIDNPKLLEFSGKKMMLFPIYKNDIIIFYGYFNNLNKISRFPPNAIKGGGGAKN
jgi:superfamily II DNA or RNA helicase